MRVFLLAFIIVFALINISIFRGVVNTNGLWRGPKFNKDSFSGRVLNITFGTHEKIARALKLIV